MINLITTPFSFYENKKKKKKNRNAKKKSIKRPLCITSLCFMYYVMVPCSLKKNQGSKVYSIACLMKEVSRMKEGQDNMTIIIWYTCIPCDEKKKKKKMNLFDKHHLVSPHSFLRWHRLHLLKFAHCLFLESFCFMQTIVLWRNKIPFW